VLLQASVKDPCLSALTRGTVVCCSYPAFVTVKEPASLAGELAVQTGAVYYHTMHTLNILCTASTKLHLAA
jgi:hypothetical protein